MKSNFFYGWVIVLCAAILLAVSNGLTLTGLTVFDSKILSEFGWSRGELKLRDFLTFTMAGLAGPLAGACADRYGVKPLMFIGSLLMALGFYLYSRIDSLMDVYLIHANFGVALASMGLIVNVILVSRWFEAKRGLALGLALVGTSLGNTIFPIVNVNLMGQGDWRQVMVWLSILPLVMIPIVLFAVREHPANIGLLPFGSKPKPKTATNPTPKNVELSGLTYQQAVRTKAFWAIAIAAMFTFYAILGVSTHLFLHLKGNGFDAAFAAKAIGVLFTMGLVGKLLFGFIADFVPPKKVFQSGLFLMLIGSFFLQFKGDTNLWVFLTLFGLGWGGLYTMLQMITVEQFGLRSVGKILGTITILDAVGGGLGPWITGILFDRFGSYQIAFTVMSCLIAIAFFASFMIGRSKVKGVTDHSMEGTQNLQESQAI